jgi:hypothetical protein
MNPGYTNIIDDLRLLQPSGPFPVWVQWVAGILAIILAGYLVWRRWKTHVCQATGIQAAQEAFEDALAELDRAHKNLTRENSRPYAITVSGIVRRYIERRFKIQAPRRSTEEFLIEASHAPELSGKYQDKLGHFLKCCDFLKFAKGFADTPELEALHQSAAIFVTETQTRPQAAGVELPSAATRKEESA